jgi:hypothetical protein
MVIRSLATRLANVLVPLMVIGATALEARASLPPPLNPAYQSLPGNVFHKPETGGDSLGWGTGRRMAEEMREPTLILLAFLVGCPLLIVLVGFLEDREM